MSVKNSSQVIGWRKTVEQLSSTYTTYRDELVSRFVAWAERELKVTIDPHIVYAFFNQIIDLLHAQLQSTVTSDLDVFRELSEDSKALDNRDTALTRGREKVIRLRKKLEGIYGDRFPATLGLIGETPREVVELSQLLASVEETLKQLASMPDPLEPDDPTYTKEALCKKVQDIRQELDTVVKALSDEKAETQQVQIKRRQDLNNINTLFQLAVNIFQGIAQCAGHSELATRVRPSTTSSSSKSSTTNTTTPDTTTPDTSPTPEATP